MTTRLLLYRFLMIAILGCDAHTASPIETYVCEEDDDVGCYEGHIIPDFYLTKGKMQAVDTWTDHDPALKLIGKPTVLSTHWLDEAYFSHIGFLAKKDSNAKLEVVFDYLESSYLAVPNFDEFPAIYGFTSDIATDTETVKVDVVDGWEWVDVFVNTPIWANYIRVQIVKKGSGSVTLAHPVMDTERKDGWKNDPLIFAGEPCDDDSDCGSFFCEEVTIESESSRVCVTCRTDADCDGISICGLEDDIFQCVVPDAKYLSRACAVDEECRDGFCCNGLCSTCCEDADCGEGETCEQLTDGDPFQCNPGQNTYPTDAACFRNEDCADGQCVSLTEDDPAYEEICLMLDYRPPECPIDGIKYGTCTDKAEL